MTVMETDRLGYPVLIGQLIDSCPELKRLIERQFCNSIIYTNMKSTEHFKNTIQGYLDQRALKDVLFAESYYKVGKNIEDCIT